MIDYQSGLPFLRQCEKKLTDPFRALSKRAAVGIQCIWDVSVSLDIKVDKAVTNIMDRYSLSFSITHLKYTSKCNWKLSRPAYQKGASSTYGRYMSVLLFVVVSVCMP